MLPLMAQASNVFGRRWLTLISVTLCTLGSGICVVANSISMLIGGHLVQGLGGGGITLMINVILTDLVPLRERGKYMAILQMVSAVGAALGPFLGDLPSTHSSWRWAFYINLPIGGTSLAALYFFLRVTEPPVTSLRDNLSRIDFVGNAIFVGSAVSIIIGVTRGGNVYNWKSFRILVPLVLGFVGLSLFIAYEWTMAKNPSLARPVLMNRTAVVVLAVTISHTICTYWAFYFMPVYFQGIRGASTFWSGVNTLPLFASILPSVMIGGTLFSKFGRYKPLHLIGMAIITISFGLLSILDQTSSEAAWACSQLLFSVGSVLMIAILLPAMQAPLDETLVALSTGVWTFIRGFGAIWGVTIPSAIFDNECRSKSTSLTDPKLAVFLNGGKSYEYATQIFLDNIEDPSSRAEVVEVFRASIRTVLYAGIAFAGLNFLLVFLEKEIMLRTKLNTKYGLEEKNKKEIVQNDLESV